MMAINLYEILRSKTAFTLVAILVALGIFRIKNRLVCERLAKSHGCQSIAKTSNRDPFFGLDTIPGTIYAATHHKLLEKSCERFITYGNTFAVKELLRCAIVTIEPKNIRTILSEKFEDYGIDHRLQAFEPLLGRGIFDTDGDHWASSRALLRPAFASNRDSNVILFEELIQDLLALLPRDGTTCMDLQKLFFQYTIDSTTAFLFGESVGTLKTAGTVSEFADAFRYAQRAVIARGMLGPLSIFYRNWKADKCNHVCRTYVRRLVQKSFHRLKTEKQHVRKAASESDSTNHALIYELISKGASEDRVLDELMNILLAGRDTTASLLSNLFFMLSRKPLVWEKLRREVGCLQGRKPTYQELKKLKYVDCCLRESLRLHPVVPRNEREAVRDTVLPLGGGKDGLLPVFVPKGTLVCYNLYALHRRQDIYGTDCETFCPERWEDEKLRPGWGYLPFNGGPRVCIGRHHAMTEVSYVVVRMAQEFQRIESRDSGPWEESLALTLCSRNGTEVCFVPADEHAL